MAEDHPHDRQAHSAANTARTLATIALILSLIALGWAIKADMRAGKAMDKANQAMRGGVALRALR